MKQFVLATFVLLLSANSYSQTAPSIKNTSGLQPALNDVIQAYFKNFDGYKGEMVSETPSVITYESKVTLPGAIASWISQYSLPDTYSFEALMLETEAFEEAAASYSRYFKQINNMKLTPAGYEKIQLIGRFDEPDDGRAFASSHFKLEYVKDGRANFYVDLGLQYEFPVWKVKIFMFEKMPDEDIRPGMPDLK